MSLSQLYLGSFLCCSFRFYVHGSFIKKLNSVPIRSLRRIETPPERSRREVEMTVVEGAKLSQRICSMLTICIIDNNIVQMKEPYFMLINIMMLRCVTDKNI